MGNAVRGQDTQGRGGSSATVAQGKGGKGRSSGPVQIPPRCLDARTV